MMGMDGGFQRFRVLLISSPLSLDYYYRYFNTLLYVRCVWLSFTGRRASAWIV